MKIERTAHKLAAVYTGLLIVVCVILGVFFKVDMPFVKGSLLGGIFTILKVFLLEATLKKAVKKSPEQAKKYAQLHYGLRFFLTLLILVIGFVDTTINGYLVALAIVLMRPAVYVYGLMMKKSYDENTVFNVYEDDEDSGDDF